MRKALFALMFAASALFTGCAVQSQQQDDGPIDEADDALAAAKLYGTWDATSAGAFYNITFTKDYAETLGGGLKGRRFDAAIDTGVRCIMAPCDEATLNASGVYRVSGSKLTLASYDKPTLEFSKVLGDYTVTLSKGTLTLAKRDGSFKQTFTKRAGEKCGEVTCGEGTVCCNPVMSICVKPGMFCIM
jgi:hypothetical protein